MSKKRVHEIAKEFGVESKQVISILQQHNFNVTKAVNTVDDAGYTVVKNQLCGKSNGPIQRQQLLLLIQANMKKLQHLIKL